MSEPDLQSNLESSDDTSPELSQLNTLKPIKSYDENNVNSSSSLEEDDQCRTPTSEEHRIPEPLVCPPAPRKPRPVACKRRRPESGFISLVVPPEEIESFFRRLEEEGTDFTSSSGKRLVMIKRCKRVSP